MGIFLAFFSILYLALCCIWIVKFSGKYSACFQRGLTLYLFLDSIVVWIVYFSIPPDNILFKIAGIECFILQIPFIFLLGKDFLCSMELASGKEKQNTSSLGSPSKPKGHPREDELFAGASFA